MNKQTNIIIILTDDLGYGDCSCYGQETWETPNIDKLAEEGIQFTDFYTTSPVCSPARTSLLTGLHSGHLPIRKLADPYLPDDVPTIPWLLKDQGYVSACIGKYGVGRGQPNVDPIRKGFDYHYGYNCMCHAHNYFPPFLRENGLRVPLRNRPSEGDTVQWETGVGVAEVKIDYSPDFIEEKALEFIESCQDKPFFLYYCPTMPHANNEGGDTPDGMEVDTYGDFEDKDWKPNEKGFARMVQRIDITVGRVVEKLKELNIAENTLLIFSSDNGPHDEGGHSVTRFNSSGGFQGYKRSLHEGGIRIPFIAWWPGTVQPEKSDFMGYFPDILTTLCDLTEVQVPENVDGISFLPLLKGQLDQQQQHDYLYFEFQTQLAIRQDNWKYFRFATDDQRLFDFDPESGEHEALHDLTTDRTESQDIKKDHPELLNEIKSIIAKEHRNYQAEDVPPNLDFLKYEK